MCTVSYGPSIFPLIYGPSTKCTGHKSTGEKQGSVMYSTEQENEVSKIFIISQRLIGCMGNEQLSFFTGHTVKYGLLNWPITMCVLTERCNNNDYNNNQLNVPSNWGDT